MNTRFKIAIMTFYYGPTPRDKNVAQNTRPSYAFQGGSGNEIGSTQNTFYVGVILK